MSYLSKVKRYFHPLTQLERDRESMLKIQGLPDSLQALIEQPIWPMDTLIKDLDAFAFDLETTGLDASQDMILSLGGVDISCGKIDLKTGVHEYVNGHQEIKAESAVINHILPKMLEEGKQLDEVMDLLFHKMLGKVVLVHGKVVEKSFLDHYVNTHYQLPFLPVVWIDTLCIEKHLTYQQSDGGHDYQLDSLRHKYHLPKYPAHNALIDSIACGELFMAQLSHIFKADKPKVTVGDVYIGK